jgi:hypothetical protein
MVAEATGPWAFTDPHRDPAIPYTDIDTAALIDEAIETLVLLRSPMHLGDAAATTSALVSLIAEAEGRLADAIADARDQDYPWDAIASRLATTTTTARRRYSAHARTRKPAELD